MYYSTWLTVASVLTPELPNLPPPTISLPPVQQIHPETVNHGTQAYSRAAPPRQTYFHVYEGGMPLSAARYVPHPLPPIQVEQTTSQELVEQWRTRRVKRPFPISLIEALLHKANVLDSQIQLFRDNPSLYREPNGSNAYFALKSQSHEVEAKLNTMALRKEWGWLLILRVPNHLTVRGLQCILGNDLLEIRPLRPHQLIASFTSSNAALSSATVICSRFGYLRMSVKLLDEREVLKLLSEGGRIRP
ncbi:unnamed protein product [Taenia asiatica]|uniref:Uncharacterized protein n=1 Tax=Taenia asiatica TaxID=60517 RepID=A0A0R3VZE7_TAEAS|nr:unnamed protein product [Taenia asiatica]